MTRQRRKISNLDLISIVGNIGIGIGIVGVGVVGGVGGVGGIGVVGVVVGGISVVVGVVVGVGVGVGEIIQRLKSFRGRGRDRHVSAGICTAQPLIPRSLYWVRSVLPGEEGTAWWAEVTSTLVETADKAERRRYVRSYQHAALPLIWVSWAEHLNASRQRELS